MGRLVLACALAIVLFTSVSLARTWYIDPDGTGDAPTIQAGIDSAAAGDTVLAACGTYYEHDIVMKSGVCLRSEDGAPACATIDAQQQGRVIYCHDVNWITTIEGFTITGGYLGPGGVGGAGIWCSGNSYPRFEKLIITENETNGSGGGMYCWDHSSARLTNVSFSYNSGRSGGGLNFDADGSSGKAVWLTDVTFTENSAEYGGGFSVFAVDTIALTNVTFTLNDAVQEGGAISCGGVFASSRYWRVNNGLFIENTSNHGGAVYTWDSHGIFENCTFVRNSAYGGGGFFSWWGFSPEIRHCTFYGNSAAYGSSIYTEGSNVYHNIIAYGTGGSAVSAPYGIGFTCCDIYGNAGGDWIDNYADQNGVNGNFSSCPAFCDTAGGDFQLCDESPCLPGNHPYGDDCGLIGAWGQGCVCGPSTTEPTTWSGIKSIYR